ncbi:PAS domain S-box-containing protein [Pricia antarctica]|uniref:histidine kinase n=1 Tax=Pricia antarctica TaxID=641691 RepID=A0A1G7CZD5_9FLAO|nr:PAS domain S-box protein [Pricia antarctica]SDE44036.1 PAS domain S-box-containing protein [Pricia antarctica]
MYASKEIENKNLFQYLDAAASIFLVIKADHSIELVNRKGCEVLGYERVEIIGKNWFHRCIPKKEKKELAFYFDQIIAGTEEPPDVYENWVVAKGNKRKLIRWRNALLKDETDKVTGLISSGVDVTEQVKTHQKLRSSEEKNIAILEALPDMMTILDKKGTIMEVQVPDPSYLFAPVEQVIGKNVKDFLPIETADFLLKAFERVGRMQKMEIVQVTAPVAKGTVQYECRLVPMAKDRILSVARNLTKTKSLQQNLEVHHRALEAAGNGILIVDACHPNLPITFCNEAFTKMTGYTREEVIGINCQFLQKDDRDQEAIATMAKAIGKGEPCHVLLRNYRKDGSLFWNDLTITPLHDEKGELIQFIGVQNDVTEIQRARKRLEDYSDELEKKVKNRTRELESTVKKLVETNLNLEDQIQVTRMAESKAQRSQAQFAAIAQNFPKGLIVVFNSDFELTYVEGEELKRVDLNKIDFEGKRIDDIPIFSKEQIEKIKEDILKTIEGKGLSFEIEFKGNCYAVNSMPLRSDMEAIVWALFVYHNITDQRKIQDKLASALKTEQELNELKSRFISMASHEFRTPLSAILSSAILIGKQNAPGLEERREKHVARIRKSVKNLVVILNDFLSLSKLEEGKVQVDPKRFELIQFSKLLLEEMEGSKKEGQYIELNHPKEDIMVYMDSKLLSHILINLLSNAAKYSEEGQKINMEISQTIEGEVTFIIKDEGLGIPHEEQKNLFERFFRAANVTNIQGTGLGLHIVKQYTELLGGSISFTSNIGKGSSFSVKLPSQSPIKITDFKEHLNEAR